MTPEQQQVRSWMAQFGQETPDHPTIPNLATRKLRAKLELEETLEKIVLGLGVDLSTITSGHMLGDILAQKDKWRFEEVHSGNLLEIADGGADQKVVVCGTDAACGLLKPDTQATDGSPSVCFFTDPLFDEVMRSNFTKLWTYEEVEEHLARLTQMGATVVGTGTKKWLVKDRDGKVIKSPSYSPPNLQPIIDKL